MIESKWIKFVPVPFTGKTEKYLISTKEEGGIFLGEIKWFARWRKYAFFPASETVFETQCLGDIVKFIEGLMDERKRAKNPAIDHK